MTSALAEIRAARGLDPYLDALESRLERAVEAHPGVVAAVGKESLAAGGKRLRPVLVFLSAPEGAEEPLAAGVSVELLHMATLVHDDLIDGAEVRRGHASVWSAHGVRTAGRARYAEKDPHGALIWGLSRRPGRPRSGAVAAWRAALRTWA